MKKRRYLLITFAVVVFLSVASLVFLHTDPGKRFLVGRLQSYLKNSHHISLRLEDVDYNLLQLSVSVRGLSLGVVPQTDFPDLLSAKYVEFELSVLDFLAGAVTIETARIEGISITTVADRNGESNLPSWFNFAGGESEAAGPDLLISSLIVKEGTFSFEDEAKGLQVDVPEWELEILGQRSVGIHSINLSTLSGSEIRILDKVLLLDRFEAKTILSSEGLHLESLEIQWDKSGLEAVGDFPLSAAAALDAGVLVSIDSTQLAQFFGFKEPVSGIVEANLSLSDSLGAPSLKAQLTGEKLSWRTLDSIELAAAVEWKIKEARVKVLEAKVSTPRGTLQGTSRIVLAEAAGNSEASVQVSGLNLEWLSGFLGSDYRISSFGSGEFRLSWPVLDLNQSAGTGEFTLSASRKGIGPRRLPVSGEVSLDATPERLLVSADSLNAGGLQLSGEVSVDGRGDLDPGSAPLSGQFSGAADDLGLVSANLASFLVNDDYLALSGGAAKCDAALSGTLRNPRSSFTLRASGIESGPMTGIDLQVVGEISRQQLGFSEAAAYWRDGSATLQGSLNYGGEERPRLDLEGSLRRLPLADLAVVLDSPISSRGEVSADFTLNGAVSEPRLDFKVRVPDWSLSGEQLGLLRVVGRFEDRVLNLPDISMRETDSEGGEVVKATGRIDFTDETFFAEIDGRKLDISSLRLGQGWRLAGLLDLSAQARGSLSNPEVDLDFRLERPSISGYELAPVAVKATLQHSQFVANVSMVDSGLSALASGRLVSPYPIRVSIRAEDADLARLPFIKRELPDLAGKLTGELLVEGNPFDWPDAKGSARLSDLHFLWNGVETKNLEPVNILYENRSLLVEKSIVTVGSGSMEIEGSLPLERAQSGSGLLSHLSFDIADLLNLLPVEWEVEGTGKLAVQLEAGGSLMQPELSGHLRVSDSGLTGSRFPVPVDDLEILISLQGDAIHLDRMSAIAGGGTLSAEGVLLDFSPTETDEPVQVSVSLEGFPLESLGALPKRMKGLATAQLELTSQKASLSEIVGVVAFGELQLTAGDLTLRQEEPVLLSLQNGQVWIERFELFGPESKITGSGGIDFLQPGSLDLELSGSVSTTFLAELIENFESSGKSQFELVIGGLPGPPQLSGSFDLENGTLLIPSQGAEVDDLALKFRVSDNQFQVESFTGDLNGGSFKGDGTVGYREGKIEAELITVLTDIYMDWPKGLRTISDGVLSLRSTEDGFLLDGELRILEGAYRDRFDLGGTIAQYLSTGRRADIALEPDPLLEGLAFEIGVETIDPIVVDNNLAEAILQGRVELRGSYYRPGMIGLITVEPGGEIYLRERTYVVEYGAISFRDESRIRPDLSMRAQTTVQEYDVTLQALGPFDNLKTSFSSEPALAEPDVVSMLLTGRTLEELRGAEASVAQEQALSLLAGAAGGQLSRGVENAIGLTQVRIEPYLIAPESTPETRLTVGQDITSDLRGIYSVSLADTGDQIWVAEYDLTRRFRARGIKQADNTYRFDFNHRLRFPRAYRSNRSSQQRQVGTLQFEGNYSFPESMLADKFKLRSGQTYDFFKAQKGLDKVRGLFDEQDLLESRIRLNRSESEGIVDLKMKIESGPFVFLAFEGDEISSDTRKRVRGLWSQGVSDSQRRRESIQEILRWLFQKGFLAAEVDCRISFVEDTKRVTFQIKQGPEFQEITFDFKGLEAFESEWLRAQLKEADLIFEFFLDPIRATEFLQGLYMQRGFLDVSIDSPVSSFDPNKSEAKVTLGIAEGPLYRVGEIDFKGNRVIDGKALLEAARVAPEDVFYPGILGDMLARVEDLYLSKGYNRAKITDSAQRAQDHRVNLAFEIDEKIQDVVREIEISGEVRVGAGFIERQMGVEIGAVLDLEIISNARKRLYDTGAFSLVEIEPVEIEHAPDSVGNERPMRLVVKVREAVPHRVNYGAFFDTDRGPGATVDYRNHNLLRNGRVLGLSGRYDGDRREFRGYFSQPARYWFPLRTYASTVVAREFRPSFEFSEFGFSIEQQAEIRDTLIGSYGFSFVRNRIRERDPDVELEDVPLNVGALNTSLAWDTRDSFLEPTGGHFLSGSFRFAPAQFGSDLPFIKYFGGYSRYFPLAKPSEDLFGGGRKRPRLIFATWVRVGLAKGLDQDTISPTERFFAGGGTTIRGFKQDTVGPVNDNGVAVGGNSLFIWNNEIRFPVFRFLDGVGFLDVGNVYPTLSDFDPTDLRKAAGFGLRIRTPFVLIRFDYGFKLDRQPGESRGAFFFSIGQAF